MRTALAVEWLKLRRSTVAMVATVLAGLLAPALAVGAVALARSNLLAGPARAKLAVALIGAEWEAHLALGAQILPVVMLLAGGLVATWLYGREFVDGTLPALFALPVSRSAVGLAKAVLAAAWSIATALLATLLLLSTSALVSSSPMEVAALDGTTTLFGASAIMGLLGLPFGLVAVATRGYFGAFTALLIATGASQILASMGWGLWVPFVAPALWGGAGGHDVAETVEPVHLVLAVSFAIAAALATIRCFRRVSLA